MSSSNHKFILEAGATGKAQIDDVKKSVDSVAASANKFVTDQTAGLNMLQSAWVKAGAAIGGAVYAINQAWDLAKVGAKADQQAKAFDNLVSSYGQGTDKILADLRKASSGTISQMAIIEKAGTAIMMGIDPSKMSKLMEIAKATARQTGQEIEKSFGDIALAVARQSNKILDNLGIIVNVEQANERWAKTLGKSAEKLNESERAQAFMNATVEAGEGLMKRLGNEAETTAEKIARFEAGVSNAKTILGQRLAFVIATNMQALEDLNAWINKPEPGTDNERMLIEHSAKLVALEKERADLVAKNATAARKNDTEEQMRIAYRLHALDKQIVLEEKIVALHKKSVESKPAREGVAGLAEQLREEGAAIEKSKISTAVQEIADGLAQWDINQDKLKKKLQELPNDLRAIEHALKNLNEEAENMGQAFQDGHWEAQEAAEAHKQALRDLYAEGMEGEADALYALQQEVDKGIEQSVKSLTEKNVEEYNRFFERVKDASADFIYEVMDGQVDGWEDMLDRVHDLFLRTFAELAAEMIAKPILVPIVASMAGSMGLNVPAGISGAGNLLSGSGGLSNVLGLGGSSGLFSGFFGGNTAATLAEGELLGGVVPASGLGMSGVSAALPYVGAGLLGWEALGGMFGLPTPSSLLGGLFGGGEKTPKLELGAGSQVQMGRPHVTTPFGLLGIDMASAIDTDQFKPLMDSIKSVTTLMADTMSDAMVASVTDAMSSWSSDKMRGEGIDAEGLFVEYFQAIGAAWNTEFGAWIAEFDGSLDELMSGIQAHLSVMNQIESIIDPNGYAIKSINQQFDAMRETLEETGGSAAEFSKLERARNITLQEEQARQSAQQAAQWEAEMRAAEQAAAAHRALIDRIMEASIATNQYGGSLTDLDITFYQIEQQFERLADDLKEAGLWAKYASEWESRLTEAKRQAVAAAKLSDTQAILGLPGVNQAGIIQSAIANRFGMELSSITEDWGRSVMAWVGTIDSMAQLQPVLEALDMDMGQFQTWIALISTGLGVFDQAVYDAAEAADKATAALIKTAQDIQSLSDLYASGASAAGQGKWVGDAYYFKTKYGIDFDLPSARSTYGAFQKNWTDPSFYTNIISSYPQLFSGMSSTDAIASIQSDFGRLGSAITAFDESLIKTTGSVENFGTAADSFGNAIQSIDDLIYRLTGGDLAPVQSAEFFTGQYAQRLASAKANPENAAAFTGFVPEMLSWMGGYGMDYKELASNTVSDLQSLKASYRNQTINVNVNVLMDGRVIGSTLVSQTYTHTDLINRFNEFIDTRVAVGN